MKLDWDETKREAMMRERGPDFASVLAAQWGDAVILAISREQEAEATTAEVCRRQPGERSAPELPVDR